MRSTPFLLAGEELVVFFLNGFDFLLVSLKRRPRFAVDRLFKEVVKVRRSYSGANCRYCSSSGGLVQGRGFTGQLDQYWIREWVERDSWTSVSFSGFGAIFGSVPRVFGGEGSNALSRLKSGGVPCRLFTGFAGT